MCEEAYDEFDLETTDGRSLVICGGYCRDEVYVGICRSKDDPPEDLVSVNRAELWRVIRSMKIGGARAKQRKRRRQRT